MDGLCQTPTVKAASVVAENLKKLGRSIGFVNGCFDLLHSGHIHLLREAKLKCDHLVVAINSDESIRKLKGITRPIVPLQERFAVLTAIRYVDFAFSFSAQNCASEITELKPHFWIKGGNYSIESIDKQELQAARAAGVRIHFVSYRGETSTSKIMDSHLSRVIRSKGICCTR